MYQAHFGLKDQPFTLTPNTQFFCALPLYQEALNMMLFSLEQGEGFLKIIGEVGLGKTLLCRELLNRLPENIKPAYLPNPKLTPLEFNLALAKELGMRIKADIDLHSLQGRLQKQLIQLRQSGKNVVLIVDEAQSMSDETLESLRLLTNLETESTKLLQVILFGQPELDQRIDKLHLRQLQQRITFSYELKPLAPDELHAYLLHRLKAAGYAHGNLFDSKTRQLLYRVSRGVPRVVNVLCHKAMLVAYGEGATKVDTAAMQQAIDDSQDIIATVNHSLTPAQRQRRYVLGATVVILLAVLIAFIDTHHGF